MVDSRKSSPEDAPKRGRPARTPEARERQLVNLAIDLAEKQLTEGIASAQVISHYLKLGSTRERLEQERLTNENKLTEAKIEAMAATERIEAMYQEALNAMRSYSGQVPEPMDEYDED